MNVKISFYDKASGKSYKFNGTSKEFKEFKQGVPTLKQLMQKARHQATIEKTKQMQLF